MPLNDLTGKKFGRLRVLSRAENASDGHAQWLCECKCNRRVVVTSQSLVCGLTNSCGCYRSDVLRARGKNIILGGALL
jgi:hypothetical protein